MLEEGKTVPSKDDISDVARYAVIRGIHVLEVGIAKKDLEVYNMKAFPKARVILSNGLPADPDQLLHPLPDWSPKYEKYTNAIEIVGLEE